MRTTVKVTLASLALLGIAGAIAACSDARASESVTDSELSRDLASASITLAGRAVDSANLATLETKPASAPEKAPVVKRAAGPKAVRSAQPTVRATPAEEEAASELSESESLSEGAMPEISEPVAVLPVPAPVVVPTSAPAGDYGSGGGIFGDGNGRIGGGGTGVVIRGGGVDGDNCELHRRPRGTRGPIYVPVVPSTRPATATRPSREGISIGSRNPGTVVNRRPSTTTTTARPATQSARPPRMDPRTARRGL
jgi:hypothetical protein